MMDTIIEIKRKITVTDGNIDDIMITAFEGGINYWVGLVTYPKDFPAREARPENEYGHKRNTYEMISLGCSIFIHPDEDNHSYELTRDKVIKGIKRYFTENPEADWDSLDANSADSIVQYALFNELVYG
jgi:hypothetical protein